MASFSSFRQKKISWTDHNTHMFLEIFVSQQEEENWKEMLLTKEGKDRLVSRFYEATGYDLKWKNFKNHYDNLKNWYKCYKRLCKKPGVFINPTTGAIQMEKEWWENQIKENPTASHLYKKPLQDLDVLEKIFPKVIPEVYVSLSDSSTGTQPANVNASDLDINQKLNLCESAHNNEIPTKADQMQPNLKRKAQINNEEVDILATDDRRTKLIRLTEEVFGSDRERAVRRVNQISNIEYNSSFYWEIIDQIQKNNEVGQMILGFSKDEHVFHYLQRVIQEQKKS